MSASITASSAPGSSRPEETRVSELNFQLPTESRKMQPPPADNQVIPDELLVSLTSTVCNRTAHCTLGQTAHHRHCKGCGMRRPDAVWHHPLGRKKYQYFLEQPTSVTGAGRDISFLCDAIVIPKKTEPLPPVNNRSGIGDKQDLSISDSLIPEEYHIVKNRGLRSLEFYEDAFTVQLQDDEQKLRVFPSLRPTGRLEVVQLTRLMEDMLLKAGVDQQTEELTELSQMEGLLELVQVEQNIYNIVFHELIRQVSVTCAERGQLLAKLRQRYVSLLERIPRRLKGLHTEAVAQRALDRRLTEEIHRIKASIQQLSMELSRIRDHDTFVSQQAENAHQQLAGAIEETHSNADVVQGYHELYELQKGRLEAQLLHMTDDRDCWSQITFCLALKVISVKKLQLISRLHVCEQSWSKTAEHCSLYVSSKDTMDLNTIVELGEYWREQLTAFLSQLKNTEHALCEHISAIQQGITTWLAFCNTQSQSPDPTCEKASLKKMCVDKKKWLNTLALQCELCQCEKLLFRQQALGDLQERWLNMSIELYRKHPSPDGEPPAGQLAVSELDQVLSELFKQLDRTVNGESGIQGQILSLLNLMESWVSKLSTVIKRPEPLSASVWLKLEKALHKWQSLAQEAFDSVSRIHTEDNKDKNMPDFYTESAKVSDKVHKFITSLSNFTDIEKHKLSEEVSCIHMALTRWMLDLLILMVPNHSEDQDQEEEEDKNQEEEDKNKEEEHNYMINISPQTLEADAKTLAERLHCFSNYIDRAFKLIQEELKLQNPLEVESEIEMNECKKLQMESIDWMDTCTILLTGVKGCAVELPVTQSEPTSVKIDQTLTSDTPVSSADSMETLVLEKVSADPTAHSEVKDETEAEQSECTTEGLESQEQEDCQQGELTVCENPVVKLIDYEGHITQRTLGESSVPLNGTEELVLSPETDEAEKAFIDLTTVGILQKELHDSELRVQSAVQRALVAEEDLQAALQKIRDLESIVESDKYGA